MAALALAVALALTGCGDDAPDAASSPSSSSASMSASPAPAGTTVVAEGLDGPTQLVEAPDDESSVWVAQLAGPEGAGTGEVVPVDLRTGEVGAPLLEGLAKPTGIAVAGGALWIQQEASLLRAPLEVGVPGEPEVVLDDMPNNGRSQGTLTLLPDGRLLYETSGTGSGPDPQEGSGVLWALDPTSEDPSPTPFATGFKGAYAHAPAGEGQVWVTEVADGTYDGEPAPGELDLVAQGDDGGWPQCTGDRVPTSEFGVTQEDCASTLAPTAVLPIGSTPTSVEVTDGAPLVALWNDQRVVRVSRDGEVTDVLVGLDRPQHLLARGDGTMLLSEFGTGRLLRFRP